jgi:hypothetical protein
MPKKLTPQLFFINEKNFLKIDKLYSIFFSKGYMFYKVFKKIYGLKSTEGTRLLDIYTAYNILDVTYFNSQAKFLRLNTSTRNLIANGFKKFKTLPTFPTAKVMLQSSYISTFQILSQKLFNTQIILCPYKDADLYCNIFGMEKINFKPYYKKEIFNNTNVFLDIDSFDKEVVFYYCDFYFKKSTYNQFLHNLSLLEYPYRVVLLTMNQSRFDFVNKHFEKPRLEKSFVWRNPFTGSYEQRELRSCKSIQVIDMNFDKLLPVKGSLVKELDDIQAFDF